MVDVQAMSNLNGKAIIAGTIKWWRNKQDGDWTYSSSRTYPPNEPIGYDLDDDANDIRRRTFFVLYPTTANDVDTDEGHAWAHWKLYGIPKGAGTTPATSATLLTQGTLIYCDHDDTAGAPAQFIGCGAVNKLVALVPVTGFPLKRLLFARHCAESQQADSAVFRSPACQQSKRDWERQRRAYERNARASAATLDLFPSFAALRNPTYGNSARDGYWFSCASGCCNADIDLM